MAVRGLRFCLAILLLAAALLVLTAKAKTDPELKQCRHQCKHQERYTERQQEQCEQRCEDYYRQKKERERQERGEGGAGGRGEEELRGERQKQLRECWKQCERQKGSSQQKQDCRTQCEEERYGKKETEPWSREEERRQRDNRREEEEEEELSEENNPYVFQMEHFSTKLESEHGRLRMLPTFSKRSKLLRGIENYRVGILQASPQTFVVPSHWDADGVLFVVSGRGTLVMILENKRHSINVQKGDIIRVPAGTPVYLTNRDENEQLYIAKFLQPVNTPGHFKVFHGAGQIFTTFSWEVLEAALKTRRDRLEKLFGQQQEVSIVKASKEQIEAMSGHDEEGRHWPFGGDEELGKYWPFGGETRGSRGSEYSFNIFSKRPSESNQYGQLHEVDRDDFKRLKDLDLMVSFANISRGSMTALSYNSRAIKIAMVVDGKGYFEMACPHLSSGRQSQNHSRRGQTTGLTTYQKVQARLNRGTVFVVPAGHPVTAVASRNSNLQIVCFEVNAENNVRYTLAGRRNIIRQMQKEAKELAFNFPSRDVDRIFNNQDEEFFFPGPESREVIRRYGDA